MSVSTIASTPAVLRPSARASSSTGKRKVAMKPRISLAGITPNNIGTVRRFDKFFSDILEPSMAEFNQLCYYNDIPVGLITCKLDPAPSAGPGDRKLYIATLGVLAPYRRQGLASRMVDYVSEAALNGVDVPAPSPSGSKAVNGKLAAPAGKAPAKPADGKASKPEEPTVNVKITQAYIHVHTASTDAKDFWDRQGFQVEKTIDGYYSKLEPHSAWLLVKTAL